MLTLRERVFTRSLVALRCRRWRALRLWSALGRTLGLG